MIVVDHGMISRTLGLDSLGRAFARWCLPLLICVATLLGISPARSQAIEEMSVTAEANGGSCFDCSYLVADGLITARSAGRLRAILGRVHGHDVLYLSGSGEDLSAGLALARVINRYGLRTIIGGGETCIDACMIAFLGGVDRRVSLICDDGEPGPPPCDQDRRLSLEQLDELRRFGPSAPSGLMRERHPHRPSIIGFSSIGATRLSNQAFLAELRQLTPADRRNAILRELAAWSRDPVAAAPGSSIGPDTAHGTPGRLARELVGNTLQIGDWRIAYAPDGDILTASQVQRSGLRSELRVQVLRDGSWDIGLLIQSASWCRPNGAGLTGEVCAPTIFRGMRQLEFRASIGGIPTGPIRAEVRQAVQGDVHIRARLPGGQLGPLRANMAVCLRLQLPFSLSRALAIDVFEFHSDAAAILRSECPPFRG